MVRENSKKEKYLNPFTDYGFKRLFGEEKNKDILLDFLNCLLAKETGLIKNLTFKPNEHLGRLDTDRRAIFDLYCENDRGGKFIIELQKTKQKFFKDRSLYYSTFPIVEQAEKSEWDYKLQPVYLVAILDFVFDEDKNDSNRFLYKVKLTDLETCKVFYEKLTFVYIEMPKYKKKLEESKDQFERWLWLINHLNKIEEIPAELKQPVFQKLFEEAEIAKFSRQEQLDYENSLKIYRDLNNSLGTARAEGFQEGMDRKEREIISKLKARGMSADEISEILK